MSKKMMDRQPDQKPVTLVPRSAVVLTAIASPVTVVVVASLSGRNGLEILVAAVLALFGLIGAAALIAYMLSTRQFPPTIGRGGVTLPTSDVEDTATSLQYLRDTIGEVV